jgi:hypothetical protein
MTRATGNLRRCLTFLLPVSAILACLMGPAQAYRMMSWQEWKSRADAYNAACPCSFQTKADCPCSYEIKTRSGGALLYYGSKHKLDPGFPQYAEIEALLNEFHPEIAFCEGSSPKGIAQIGGEIDGKSRDDVIASIGEPGFVVFLKQHDPFHKVRVRSPEPRFAVEVDYLRRKGYREQQIKLYYIIKYKTGYDRMEKKEKTLEDYLDSAIKYGLHAVKAPPYSIGELESIYGKYFPGSYRGASDDMVDPGVEDPIFNRIARDSSDYRDQVMVGRLSHEACAGKRVLAVVGLTHVVMQRSALTTLLEKCP